MQRCMVHEDEGYRDFFADTVYNLEPFDCTWNWSAWSISSLLNFVAHAVEQLQGTTGIKVACVIGFHEGTQSTSKKVSESKAAIAAGATELDVVLNRTQLPETTRTWFHVSSDMLIQQSHLVSRRQRYSALRGSGQLCGICRHRVRIPLHRCGLRSMRE